MSSICQRPPAGGVNNLCLCCDSYKVSRRDIFRKKLFSVSMGVSQHAGNGLW